LKKNPIRKNLLSHPLVWCFSTYFAEGFPYSIIRTVSSFFFRTMNVSLDSIGLTSFFGFPWVLKFFWAPHIDRFLTKRWWLTVTQGTLAVLFLLCGFLIPFSWSVQASAVIFMIGAFIAATHDIAIDGYYVVALDNDDQSRYVGFRVLAYRCALMAGSGIIASVGVKVGWMQAFIFAGVVLSLLTVYHVVFLPECQTVLYPLRQFVRTALNISSIAVISSFVLIVVLLRAAVNSGLYNQLKSSVSLFEQLNFPAWINIFLFGSLFFAAIFRKKIAAQLLKNPQAYYARAFISFMEQEKIAVLIAFIILLRTGEILLSNMVSPFIVDCGLREHFGWLTALVGLPSSIGGALLGGYFIYRYSLKKMIIPFLLLQNGTNLLYMWLGFDFQEIIAKNVISAEPVFMGVAGLIKFASVHGFDQFAGGLGTSVLMTFLMRMCKGEYKAAHYAIGSGLMNLSGIFAGALSGVMASRLGYGWFFGISFLAAIPGMVLVIPLMKTMKED